MDVEPFAVCLLHAGWRLRLPGNPGTVLHFVLDGTGTLRSPQGDWELGPQMLAVVPVDVPHSLECGTGPLSDQVIRSVPECEGMLEIEAGAGGSADLRIACGLIQVT